MLMKEPMQGLPRYPGLRLHTPSAGGLGLIPGQGPRLYMPQLRGRMHCN